MSIDASPAIQFGHYRATSLIRNSASRRPTVGFSIEPYGGPRGGGLPLLCPLTHRLRECVCVCVLERESVRVRERERECV